ncbi:MAG: hypothetical protein ACO2PL_06960 [Armatimonadota bacterium]
MLSKFFSAVREHCPPEKLFAIRHSLFAVVLARQEPRPPIFAFVPRPASHDPFRSCPVSLVPCPV